VDKESRIELLRRQRLFQGEKKVKHISHHAIMQLNDDKTHMSNFIRSLFNKKEKMKSNLDRPYPLSANETAQNKQVKIVKKIHLSWRILSCILVIFFSAIISVAWQSPDFQISQVEIQGLERISQDEATNSIDILQKPIITIQPEEIIQNIISAFPEFKEVRITVALPNKVTIHVTERKPIIAWKVNETTIWIDTDGVVFPERGQAGELLTIESYSLPVFSYPKEKDETDILLIKFQPKRNYWKLPPHSMIWYKYHRLIDSGLLSAIVQLNTQIPSEKVLLYDSLRGLGWNDPRGWKIFIGFNLERINEKWLAYEKIASELINQGIQPTMVSVEYLHAPYYRLD
jgi:cell division protein FtsQ